MFGDELITSLIQSKLRYSNVQSGNCKHKSQRPHAINISKPSLMIYALDDLAKTFLLQALYTQQHRYNLIVQICMYINMKDNFFRLNKFPRTLKLI